MSSLPVRERGLKSQLIHLRRARLRVAPRAGAWIEIGAAFDDWLNGGVAPRAGAWIEMFSVKAAVQAAPSLPVRERGLKSPYRR